jgi:hypothetical protein
MKKIFNFLDDDVFNQALDKLIQELEQERPLTTLLITGIDDAQEVHSILQKY